MKPSLRTLVATGPESAGKTTIAEFMCTFLNAPLVPEYAVDWLMKRNGKYGYHDLERIAKVQINSEVDSLKQANKWLVCDTDITVLYIWSQFKYQKVCDFIQEQLDQLNVDNRLYLLCSPDIPWEAHPLREHPNDRKELFLLYKDLLDTKSLNYQILSGIFRNRTKQAIEFLRPYR